MEIKKKLKPRGKPFKVGHKINVGKKWTDEHRKKLSDYNKKNKIKPSFAGFKHSEKTKKIIRNKKLGTKHSEDTKQKMRDAHKGKHSGENCHFWKGGVTTENELIRKGVEYRLWREAVFARDRWTCQECGIVGDKIHAHHIKRFSQYPELRFAINNGITLCIKCHAKTNNFGGKYTNNIEVTEIPFN